MLQPVEPVGGRRKCTRTGSERLLSLSLERFSVSDMVYLIVIRELWRRQIAGLKRRAVDESKRSLTTSAINTKAPQPGVGVNV